MLELCIVNNYDIQSILQPKTISHIENIICLSSQMQDFLSVKPVGLLIDYPYGQANSKIREHEILYGVRNNVQFIDLTLNNKSVQTKDFKYILSEIKTFRQIIDKTDAKLRIIIEHFDIDICTAIYNHGYSSYIIVGTGVYNTDINDVLINSALIQEKTGMKAIATVQFLTETMLESLKKNNIYGIRTMSQKSLERIFK